GKEVSAAVPVLELLHVHQSQVDLVDQGGSLERLARCLLGHLLGGQPPQLVVNQRQQLLGGVRVALLDGVQDASDLTHDPEDNRGRGAEQMDFPGASRVGGPNSVAAGLAALDVWSAAARRRFGSFGWVAGEPRGRSRFPSKKSKAASRRTPYI